MKRKLACLLSLTVLLGAMTACGGNPPETGGEEGDSVVLCIESSMEREVKELVGYIMGNDHEGSYELLVLPDDPAKRETELSRIRTEIMAGGGPDVFLLQAHTPRTLDPPEPLFANPEKTMYENYFLDLTDYVENSEIIDLASCNAVVMDVGVTEESRFLLPLLYTCSMMAIDRDKLQNPDFTFTSLKELQESDETVVKEAFGQQARIMFPDGFGILADYASGTLLLTAKDIEAQLSDIAALQADVGEPSFQEDDPFEYITCMDDLQRISSRDCVLFPMPNREGGVTADVNLYTAINRNTAHPDEAFTFVELLLSDELQSGVGFSLPEGRVMCALFGYGNSRGIPVKDHLLPEHRFITQDWMSISEATLSDTQEIAGRINAARIFSDLDELLSDCGPSAQSIQENLTTMQMKLSE